MKEAHARNDFRPGYLEGAKAFLIVSVFFGLSFFMGEDTRRPPAFVIFALRSVFAAGALLLIARLRPGANLRLSDDGVRVRYLVRNRFASWHDISGVSPVATYRNPSRRRAQSRWRKVWEAMLPSGAYFDFELSDGKRLRVDALTVPSVAETHKCEASDGATPADGTCSTGNGTQAPYHEARP